MKREPEFKSEAELCAAFNAWAKGRGWTPYAETAGWDVLLVAADGTQIGVQAKMRLNVKVLSQAVPSRWDIEWRTEGPDFRAILVPRDEPDATDLCTALGLAVFHPLGRGYRDDEGDRFAPEIGDEHRPYYKQAPWHWWGPAKRCELPAYVPDVPAGASGPVQLTPWKVAALKITALLELRGHVTRDDFRRLGIDHRRWAGPGGWLDIKDGVYVRGERLAFDRQHPIVYQQVLADVRREWGDDLLAAT